MTSNPGPYWLPRCVCPESAPLTREFGGSFTVRSQLALERFSPGGLSSLGAASSSDGCGHADILLCWPPTLPPLGSIVKSHLWNSVAVMGPLAACGPWDAPHLSLPPGRWLLARAGGRGTCSPRKPRPEASGSCGDMAWASLCLAGVCWCVDLCKRLLLLQGTSQGLMNMWLGFTFSLSGAADNQ